MNRCCYDLDYLLGLTGWTLRPATVLAQTWNVPPPFAAHVAPESDAETHVTAFIRCAGGEAISLERAEYVAAAPSSTVKIVGECASLQLDTIFQPGREGKKVVLDKVDPARGIVSETVWSGDDPPVARHTHTLNDFITAIREDRPCDTSLEKALIVQQITDAIYESAESAAAAPIR